MAPDKLTSDQLIALGYKANGKGKRHIRPLLVCDVDEVILHLVDPFEKVLNEMGFHLKSHSFKLTGNIFQNETDREATQDEVWQGLDLLFKEQATRQHLVDGAKEALVELSQTIDILFLTNLPHVYGDIRREYLQNHGINYPLVTNTNRKTHAIKILQDHCDAPVGFIDDTPFNLEQVRDEVDNIHLFHFVANDRFRNLAGEVKGASEATGDWSEVTATIQSALTIRPNST